MKEQRLVPAREARHEIKVSNSRFIATAGPVMSVDEAKVLVARVRREYPDATHHVLACVIGHGNSVTMYCNDDGEPSGTAGRPALAVLKGTGLGDIAVVVSRYYGGTNLGTGGLTRAYGDAVRVVLATLARARKVSTHTLGIRIPYACFERVRRLILAHRGQLINQEFGENVILVARLDVIDFDLIQDALRDASGGQLQVTILETNPYTLMPL
jgi:uncharacterized YigZ family protein